MGCVMSYCRMGEDSDVYLYCGPEGIVCCSCRLQKLRGYPYVYSPDFILKDQHSAIMHLALHRARGHRVPLYATSSIREDLEKTKEGKLRRRKVTDLLSKLHLMRYPE